MKGTVPVIMAAAIVLAGGQPVLADGALAIGMPANVAAGGVAFGVSWDEPGPEAAQQGALTGCKSAEGVPQSTRNACRIVHNFSGQCVSVAVDPQAGTTGFGWGKGYTTTQSRYEALTNCRATAGERVTACIVVDSTCD